MRALLYETWCPKCGPKPPGGSMVTHMLTCDIELERAPLATRLPQCVPAGMEWHEQETSWNIAIVGIGGLISGEHAELLFMGQAVKVLACDPRPMPRDIEEFAVALHKLADEMGV